MNKWQQWYDNLPQHTKTYLDSQAIWRDSDVFKFTAIAFVTGFILGAVIWAA